MIGDSTTKKIVSLHVYAGGVKNVQVAIFPVAVKEFKEHLLKHSSIKFKIDVKYMYCDDVRSKRWSPADFVDWLLSSNYHFVLTHVHQGLPHWNCETVVLELSRLRGHPGFPANQELSCPVFLQDKRLYIKALESHAIPTFFISLPFQRLDVQLVSALVDFLNVHEDNAGFVVKFPFVTNSEGLRFPKSTVEVISYFKHLKLISFQFALGL